MVFPLKLIKWIVFLDLLAVSLIIPLTPHYARKLGASQLTVGLLGSIYAGFQLCSGPLFGSLSDLKGRRTILIVTLLVCGVAYAMTGLTTSIMCLLCLRAVLGIFKQTQMLTRAMVADYEKSERVQSKIYGEMAAISGVGFTLGPVIGGHAEDAYPEYGFRCIGVVVGICFLINSGLVYCLPPVKRKDRKKQAARVSLSSPNAIIKFMGGCVKQSVIQLTKVPWLRYWDVFMLKALIGFAMGVYFSNYAIYLKSVYDLSPKYIGYVISFQGIVGSLTSYFMGSINKFYINDCDFSLRNLHVFVLISSSLLGLIMALNIYVYILWLIPLAVGNAVGRLVTLEVILRRSRGEHRGTLIGASNSVRSLSGVVAPMVAGFIAHYYGVSYVIHASLFATLLGLGVSFHTRYLNKIKVD